MQPPWTTRLSQRGRCHRRCLLASSALLLMTGMCGLRGVEGASLLTRTTPRSTQAGRGVPQMNNHQNISNLLDSLLRGYDNSIRPNFGGAPAVVEVDIMVRSMGPISEVDMTYSMDCYFRQSWVDRRLAFPGDDKDTLALSISMLARIWKPDTYFYNGKQSYLHTITTPNKFVRLYRNGRVLYSSRLTIKAGCPMNLEDFPMDVQRCPLKFGSFGYTTQDLLYRWNVARQVAIAEDMKLSQFDLIATPAANHTDSMTNGDKVSAEYSMLLVSFHLQRHMGNFLIQVYGPCVLLVVLSWVSFWLNREATADRVSLGITTVLTMTFLGLEARTDLPKVPYPTALDFFVFLSFAFIFATIIQFAVVHYFTKYGSGECYFGYEFNSDSDDSSSDEERTKEPFENITGSNNNRNCYKNSHVIEVIPLRSCTIPSLTSRRKSRLNLSNIWSSLRCTSDDTALSNKPATKPEQPPILDSARSNGSNFEIIEMSASATAIDSGTDDILATSTSTALKRLSLTSAIAARQTVAKRRKRRHTPRFNSVSKIDRVSRIFFPLLFLTINIFYWYNYLARTERIDVV